MLAEINVFGLLGNVMYVVLALIALWGGFCVVMVWMRVSQKRFRSEDAQADWLDAIAEPVGKGDFEEAEQMCEGDPRALPQLAALAVANRKLGYSKVRQLIVDRFQRDVLADLEYRLSWVNTVIKSAPMVGLLGTVMGMMGAFEKLGSGGSSVRPDQLATDIMLALITTASGLAIAIPLILCTAYINIQISKMEDLVAAGLSRFLEIFKEAPEGKKG